MKQVWERIKDTFALDERSLALVRVLFGLVLFFDSITRWKHFNAFFSVDAIISRDHFLTEVQNAWNWSIFAIAPSDFILHGLYAILVFLTVLFTFGYRHKLTTILLWFFLCSLQNRNWYINNSGDDLQRVALFIMFFLPMTKHYSIDNALNKIRPSVGQHESVWSFIYILQICVVYIISYYLKGGHDWHISHRALEYAFGLEYFTNDVAKYMLNFPSLLKLLTKATMILEGFLPYLLLAPLFYKKSKPIVRYIVVASFVMFHLSLIMTYKIGAFPWTCIVIWLGLLPSDFWNIFQNKGESFSTNVFYDGECGFCKKGVYLIKQFFLLRDVQVQKAQDNADVFNKMNEHNSWVIEINGEYFYKYEAFIQLIARNSFFFFITPALKLISPIGELVYGLVSNNRKTVSHLTVRLKWHETNEDKRWKGIKVTSTFVGITYLICVGQWCLNQAGLRKYYSPKIARITQYMNWYQNWGMFAPNVRKDYGWISIEATAKNGDKWDLHLDKPYDGKKPDCISCSYKSKEWRKFFLNYTRNDKLREQFGVYQCQQWNKHLRRPIQSPLKEFKVMFYSRTVLDGPEKDFQAKVLWHHFCYKNDLADFKKKKAAHKSAIDAVKKIEK